MTSLSELDPLRLGLASGTGGLLALIPRVVNLLANDPGLGDASYRSGQTQTPCLAVLCGLWKLVSAELTIPEIWTASQIRTRHTPDNWPRIA